MPVGVALCSFEGPPEDGFSPFSGGHGEGETPLPIPNRAVKPLSADGTWPARARESRTPPVFYSDRDARWGSLSAVRVPAPLRSRPRGVVRAGAIGVEQTCGRGDPAPGRRGPGESRSTD